MEYVTPLAQLITAVALAFNCWQSWHNGRKADSIVATVADIREQTNGINSQLVKVVGEAKYAEGIKHGEEYAKRNGT